MSKLRLVVTQDCPRSCEGCCNKDQDISNLPIVQDYSQYDVVMLTGGEPLLYVESLINLTILIDEYTSKPIIVYTAMVNDWLGFLRVLYWVDGITLTLHEQADVEPFMRLCAMLTRSLRVGKSLRLNVFKGVKVAAPDYWIVKGNMEWIENCPLPKNEVLMRLPTWITD